MTSLEMPKQLYIPCAFASKSGAAYTAIENTESNNVNFETGFPAAYGAPASGNGKFITRGEMNAIGRLASQNHFAKACGAIVTFDPQLATKIGGYPRGAVLEFLEGLNYNKVISLVENNMVDFRGATDKTLYSSVINGTVDGEHWAFLGNGEIANMEVLCKIGNIGATPRNSHIPIGGFRAPRTGIPYFEGDYSFIEVEFPEGQTVTGNPQLQIYLFEGTTDPTSLDGVNIASNPPSGVTKTCIYDTFGNTGGSGAAQLKAITAGKYYSVWASISFGGLKSEGFALKIA